MISVDFKFDYLGIAFNGSHNILVGRHPVTDYGIKCG